MSHLYLHIPFCKQACHYCDFHFSTNVDKKAQVVEAIRKELLLRKNELKEKELSTIYFGGGTPSRLTIGELNNIFHSIGEYFSIRNDAEITLEANPDDLTEEYLSALKETPVNRLSIGIQSFRDADLHMMNRAHDPRTAVESVKRAQDAGFNNITIDLIYGIPGLSDEDWLKNLHQVASLGVQHLSAYCLTVEPRTALSDMVKKGKVNALDDESSSRHFELLVKFAEENGFGHYEISNFAKEGFISRHNSSYWFGEPYLGVGPSAHSFDGTQRRWNVSNNNVYLKNIAAGEQFWQEEILTPSQRYNEYVMIRLRTKWGIDPAQLERLFGKDTATHFVKEAEKWLKQGFLEEKEGRLSTNGRGKLLVDRIASDLFLV